MFERNVLQDAFGDIAPGLVDYTERVVFDDLWTRPDLSPRDRSLVTISALVALQRLDQLRTHIGIGLRNGLSQEEIAAAITHLAFYSGWPTAISAIGVAKAAFAENV